MKRKILVTLLTVALCACGSGCGKSSSGNPPDLAYDAGVADSMKENLIGYENDSVPDDTTSAIANEREDAPKDITEENQELSDNTEPKEAGTGEIEGIMVVQADWSDLYRPTYTIYAIDPEDGSYREISNFWFDSVFERTNPEYTIVPALQFMRYANLYDQFSSDYTKTAATKTFANNGEAHAGWITTDGSFFDVTEALDEQSHGDFDDAVNYQAVGFQDDVFIYVHSEGFEKNQYYGVAVDNVVPGASWEISTADSLICEDYATWQYIRGYKPTDWIDDDRLIVEANNMSYIATVSTQSRSEYIPASDSRYSWSAVVNPEGTKVAFLSEPKSDTTGDVGIYIMPVDGGDPIRLETTFLPSFSMSAGSTVKYFGVKQKCCSILEWK